MATSLHGASTTATSTRLSKKVLMCTTEHVERLKMQIYFGFDKLVCRMCEVNPAIPAIHLRQSDFL